MSSFESVVSTKSPNPNPITEISFIALLSIAFGGRCLVLLRGLLGYPRRSDNDKK